MRIAKLFGVVIAVTMLVSFISSVGLAAAKRKTETNLLTLEEIAQIRKSGQWGPKSPTSIRVVADKWTQYTSRQLRDLVPPAWVPRAFDVHFEQCPLHAEEIKSFGKYPWIIDPAEPYKVKCPVGGEVYPTNDFDPTKPSSLLSVSSEPYIDNGWGWRQPGETQKYWFVAYYTHWLYHGHLRPAVLALGEAYVLTGDQKYARQAAVLLDRMAEEYPEMDYVKQSRFGTEIQPGNYHGRIINSIWETGMVSDLATAYDYIFPGMEDDAALEQATGKSVAEIRRNIEVNLLEEAATSIFTMDGRIRGNFGMHQSSLVTLAIVLDNENTDRYIDAALNATGLGNFAYEGILTGLDNFVFRDGAPNESSPGYNSLWLTQFNEVAEILLRRGINLYTQEPKLKQLFDYPLRLAMLNKFSPNIGDTGGVISEGVVGWSMSTYQTAFEQYGDRAYVVGRRSDLASDNMSAYGLAMLRTGKGSSAAGLAMYYGPGGGHDHYDRLNIELFAEGVRLSPDLGYPEFASGYHKKRFGWTGHTISHNTVLVDGTRQLTKDGGRIQAFASLPGTQYVDVRAEEAYPGMVERYQRSVAVVDAPGDDSYILDVFRVAGGNQHDYSIHGPDGSFSVQDVALSALQEKGTLAGENVPFGYLYDQPAMERPGYTGAYTSYLGSGFSYLKNVQRAQAGNTWSATWKTIGSDVHFRTTFLPQPGTEVIVADGEPPKNTPGNPETLKYVLARTTAKSKEPLESTFVTVLQPFRDKPFVTGAMPIGGKMALGSVGAVGVQVDHLAGSDFLFQSVDDGLHNFGDEAQFQGDFGVIARTAGGSIRHASLVGGGVMQQGDVQITALGSYTGQIEWFDQQAGKIGVALDADSQRLPLNGPEGQRIVIYNGAHSTEYVISKIAGVEGNKFELLLEDPLFLTGHGEVISTATSGGTSSVNSKTPLILGASYYKGQWLVNPATGEGRRIIGFNSHGTPINVEGDALQLSAGDAFEIYDFGPGDSFRIISTVNVVAGEDGRFTIASNVTGQLVLWDGVERPFAPGWQEEQVEALKVQIHSPARTEETIAGTVQIQFSVEQPSSLGVESVQVQVDGDPIKEGNQDATLGSLVLDTTSLEDGVHVLSVAATDSFGKTYSVSLPVKVSNWWEIVTGLPEPVNSGWFGAVDFTKLHSRSSGWKFVKGNSQAFLGDNERLVRTSQTSEFLIWPTPNLKQFEITLYSKKTDLGGEVSLAVSRDGLTWIPISAETKVGAVSDEGWLRLDLIGQVDHSDTAFLQVTVKDTIPQDELQVGNVYLKGKK